MNAEQAIVRLLVTDAGVSAIVAGRVYPGLLPESTTYPAVAYEVVSETPNVALDGVNPTRAKRFRFWSATHGVNSYGAAKALDAALRDCLEGFAGIVSDGLSPESTLEIQGVFPLSTYDLYESETETRMVISDFSVVA
jgi:Protein of unknown function (DUF3168)